MAMIIKFKALFLTMLLQLLLNHSESIFRGCRESVIPNNTLIT
jgi:hypothetical protein